MSRRRRPDKREILPDPKFGDIVLTKFMNSVMLDGKKSVAEGIIYGALDQFEQNAPSGPDRAVPRCAAQCEAGHRGRRSRRVGGATYQVPVEVRSGRAARRSRSAG